MVIDNSYYGNEEINVFDRPKVYGSMINCISLMLMGRKLNCIANHLGGGPNAGLVGSTTQSLECLYQRYIVLSPI